MPIAVDLNVNRAATDHKGTGDINLSSAVALKKRSHSTRRAMRLRNMSDIVFFEVYIILPIRTKPYPMISAATDQNLKTQRPMPTENATK